MTSASWDDARLDAAFEELARANPTPRDLVATTTSALTGPKRSPIAWRGLIASTALVVATIAVVGGVILGYGVLRPAVPSGASPTFIDGPSPDLRTLDAGTFRFDFPASWHAMAAKLVGSGGGSPIALLGTETVDAACGSGDTVDMDCIYQLPLAPGAIRVEVSTEGIRGGTIFGRQDIENGTTTRPSIGTMPAVLDTFDPAPGSYYREDASRRWSIAMPGNLGQVVSIELLAREWPNAGTGTTTADVDAISRVMIDSFRFTPPPAPLPADPAAAVAAGRAALQSAAASFRSSYITSGDSASIYFDCLSPAPEVVSDADVRFGPGGDLGGLVRLECSWSIAAESSAIWQLEATYRWTVGAADGIYIETRWLDARGTEIGSTFRGDPPPAVGPVATETEPPATSGSTEPPGTPIPSDAPSLALPVIDVAAAIAIRDASVDAREIAVHGWFVDGGPVPCPSDPSVVSSLQLDCPEDRVWLMRDPQSIFTVDGNGGETMRPPTGPALNPDLDAVGQIQVPPRVRGTPVPITLVLVGHFDDSRAATCPADAIQACRDRFVVTAVWTGDGRSPLAP